MSELWHSARLIYRAVEVEDEPFFTSLASDEEAHVNSSFFLPVTQGKRSGVRDREFFESCRLSAVICLPAPAVGTGAHEDTAGKPIPVGVVHVMPADVRQMHHRRDEIGINIARPYQRQGYGSEAIQWILSYAFRFMGLHKMEISAFGFNTGAVRLYERLGFVVEGRKREHYFVDGRWQDHVMLGMTEDEWRARYGNVKKSD